MVGTADPYTSIDTSLLETAFPVSAAIGPQLDDTPAVSAATAERDALAAQVRIEEKRPIPNIGVSVGFRRFQGISDSALVVGLSATIPLFDRNRGAIDAARERTAAADWRLEAARLQSAAARRSALAQVAAAQGRLAAAEQGERAASEAYRLGRIGYSAGRSSLLELLTIRRALGDARSLIIDARLARVRAIAALAQAEGRVAFGD
ncbi:MAG: TolC family protein [Sphingomonadaceae bacterium]|nr:TolC family protein [Sphingomonadaceae bacterium]